ncbi:stress-induced-phosphoprotein 1, partial [Tremellales sp. Uapishka_1]
MADALKAEANKAFAAKDYPAATKLYTEAIAVDPTNHVLFSNRSASKAGQKDYEGALEDAEKTIELSPSFSKGYSRKGAALHGLRQYPEAVMAYETGLQADPDSALLKKGLAEVSKAMQTEPDAMPDMGMGQMFADPGLFRKLESHPKTRDLMKDPGFAQKIRALQAGQGKADMGEMFRDPRMMSVLGVMMGIDMEAMERPQGSNEMPPSFKQEPSEDIEMPSSSSSSRPAPTPSKSAPAPAPAKEEPVEESMEVDDPSIEAKKQAGELKVQGNAAYKAKRFDEAIELYTKAWEVSPTDATYLTNLSAVYFEKGEYEKCIETCEKAVEEGRSLRTDYKTIAKAFGRIGSAYSKLNDLTNAIKFYGKSLTEHRTPEILTKLREAEKTKLEGDKQAYIDPEKAEAAREEGNVAFKGGNFADAVKSYTEAIKRLPSDPKAYNNRAAAYTKLVAFPEALKDAEQAIKLDPSFIKAYIRKALVQMGMREYTMALETCQKATEMDVEKKHTRELETNMAKIMAELQSQRSGETDEQTYERAMRDPEVQSIMSDPLMRQILQDSQQDPRALMDHMKNPMISAKIQKLINAGIIKTR